MATTHSPLEFEWEFWGDCANTLHEEGKQLVYAARMGLVGIHGGAHPPTFDLAGRSVIDIGGGPVSLLLKCVNRGRCTVVDPCPFPDWVVSRYEQTSIQLLRRRAESLPLNRRYDEAWIYNVLQHVDDPNAVVARARQVAATIRLFEWIDIPAYPGHPHTLTKALLDEWLDATGFVVQVDESGAVGRAYYGVFVGTDRATA